MGKTFSLLGLAGAATLTILSGVTPVMAQESQGTLVAGGARSEYHEYPDTDPLPTIPQEVNRVYYSHDGNFFDNRGILQSFRLIFGIPNYVENAISQDGRAVDNLYKELLEQQVSSDPVLRTPDLPNPYTGSVLTTPLVITEEPILPLEPFPTIRRNVVEPAPAPAGTRTTTPARPVPALW